MRVDFFCRWVPAVFKISNNRIRCHIVRVTSTILKAVLHYSSTVLVHSRWFEALLKHGMRDVLSFDQTGL